MTHASIEQSGAPVVPVIRYRNLPAAINWLCAAFGFEKHRITADSSGTIIFAQLTFGPTMIMVGPVRDFGVRPVSEATRRDRRRRNAGVLLSHRRRACALCARQGSGRADRFRYRGPGQRRAQLFLSRYRRPFVEFRDLRSLAASGDRGARRAAAGESFASLEAGCWRGPAGRAGRSDCHTAARAGRRRSAFVRKHRNCEHLQTGDIYWRRGLEANDASTIGEPDAERVRLRSRTMRWIRPIFANSWREPPENWMSRNRLPSPRAISWRGRSGMRGRRGGSWRAREAPEAAVQRALHGRIHRNDALTGCDLA